MRPHPACATGAPHGSAPRSRIRAQFDRAILAAHKLPSRVSQTWLHPKPGTYPLTVAARLTGQVDLGRAYMPADRTTHTPAPGTSTTSASRIRSHRIDGDDDGTACE